MKLETRKLNVSIGGRAVCRDLDLLIEAGSRWAVLGVNGAGKTTLLLTLAGLRAAASGDLLLNDQAFTTLAPRVRAQQLALMLQDDHDDPETTVLETALLGRLPHLNWWQAESENDECIAHQALATVDLNALCERRAATLSGGERRRLALAALIAQQSPLLLLDEPTSHLDIHQQIALLDVLLALPQRTLLMTLHDVNLAARYCTHVLMLFGDGEACAGTTEQMLSTVVLSRLYRHPVAVTETPQGKFYFPA